MTDQTRIMEQCKLAGHVRTFGFVVVCLMLSLGSARAQYPFVTPTAANVPLPAEALKLTSEMTARWVQGSTATPIGRTSELVVRPVIRLDLDSLPGPLASGRPVLVSGELLVRFHAPGDFILLKEINFPIRGKGTDGESALRNALLESGIPAGEVRQTYDAALADQTVAWNDCTSLLGRCDRLAANGQRPAALLLLGCVPPGTPCSGLIQERWTLLMNQQKDQRCEDLWHAAVEAARQQDDDLCLRLSVAADVSCHREEFLELMTALQQRLDPGDRYAQRMIDRAITNGLRPEEHDDSLLSVLFEQVVGEFAQSPI